MQLVALPTDERNRPRTQADYGEPYRSSYAESEKEYLSALAKSLSDYGKPGADPLAMPFDIGAANLTKNEMLRALGKGVATDIERLVKYQISDYGRPSLKELKGRIKSTANEIRSAPEGTFVPIDKLTVSDHPIGSHWNPNNKELVIEPRELSPKTLRHENAHAWQDLTGRPNELSNYKNERIVAESYGNTTAEGTIFDIIRRKFPHARSEADLATQHGYNPYELAAINEEYKPLGRNKTLNDYMDSLFESTNNALQEAHKRKSAVWYQSRRQFPRFDDAYSDVEY